MDTTPLLICDIGYLFCPTTDINDEILFNIIIDVYNDYDHAYINIHEMWYWGFRIRTEDGGTDYEKMISFNLSVIKHLNYGLYKTLTIDYRHSDDYEKNETIIFWSLLEVACRLLKNKFQKKFMEYINNLEGDELSDNDTVDSV
jgi:hypothetical protein